MNIGERSESGCCGRDLLFGGGRDLMNGHGRVQSWAQDREAPLKGDLRAATLRLHPPKGNRMGWAGGPCPRGRCRSVRRGPAGLPPERRHQPASAVGCVAEEAHPPGLPQECRSPPFSDELWSAWRNQRQCFSHCPGTSERASLPVPSACDSQGELRRCSRYS